ncbi:MAG: right-handed parallel beta-helix repeat-containing protein, partial [Thermoplasmata archaeon]|nr:right-handed parallel beta-helix repeat-containing protein [Thermoplasmata archaeon]
MKKATLILILAVVVTIAAVAISEIYNMSNNAGDSRNCAAALDCEGNMHVVWQDNSNGRYAIYYKEIYSNGSISDVMEISNSTGNAINPSIAGDGSVIHIAWQDDRDGMWRIYYKRISASGIVLMNEMPISVNESFAPTIAAKNGSIFIAWSEDDGGEKHIHYATFYLPPNTPPEANFTYSPKIAGMGDNISFVSTSYDAEGNIVNYTWQFGDGSIGYGSVVNHSYSAWGNYTVNLTVIDAYGESDTISKIVKIGGAFFVSPSFNASVQGFGIDHYNSIQDAINNASNNATIKVYPGLYKENVVIDKPLKLIDDPAGPYINAIIDGGGDIGINITTSNVLVRNITVYNFSLAILVHNASHQIDNITIDTCKIFNTAGGGGTGIKFDGVDDGIINNTKVNSTGYGIYLDHSSNITISECNITHNSMHGIYLYSSSNNSLFNNVLMHNGIGGGIYATNSSNGNTLERNIASYNGWSGIELKNDSNNNVVRNNSVNNNDHAGIWVYSSDNNTILNNIVRDNDWSGIELKYGSEYNKVENNSISNNEHAGIYIHGSSENRILNNDITLNKWSGIELNVDSCNNIVKNNSVDSNSHSGIWVYDSCNNTISGNTVTSNGWQGIDLYGNANNNILKNNVVNYNHVSGIYVTSSSNNTITNITARDNVAYAFYSDNRSKNNIVNDLTVARYPITVSFVYGNGIALKGVNES